MDFRTAAANDVARFDNLEEVTVVLNRFAGQPIEFVTEKATRRAISLKTAQLLAMTLTGKEIVWNIPAVDVVENEIKPDDLVRDISGKTWEVVSSELLTFGSRFRCVCVLSERNKSA